MGPTADQSLNTEPAQGQLKAGAGAPVAPKPVVQLSLTDRILGSLARYRISVWSINGIGLALIVGVGLLLTKKFKPLVGCVLLLAAALGAAAQARRSYAYRAGIPARAKKELTQQGQDSSDATKVENKGWEIEMRDARKAKNAPLKNYLSTIMPDDARVHLQNQIEDEVPRN